MKKNNVIITLLFCAFLMSMGTLTAFLPKRGVSLNEKRMLAQFPKFSVAKLMYGTWENAFEDYVSDHFPARSFFTGLNSYYQLFCGKPDANGIYKGKDGYLIAVPAKYDLDNLTVNIEAVCAFSEKTGLRTSVMAVPSVGYIMQEKLPSLHTKYRDGEMLINIHDMCEGKVGFIDISGEFFAKKAGAQLYYKTDHHWTSEGAYTAYNKWAEYECIGVREKPYFDIEKTDGFYGTAYTKSALWEEKPDVMEMWEYPVNVTVEIDDGVGVKKYDTMFFKERLDEPDKYPVFLDGNHGFERITNHDNPDGMRVLVIKDSFAHSFVPFMAENCSVIDMVDMRYYRDEVSKLTEENDYDSALVLCSVNNLCESADLSALQ